MNPQEFLQYEAEFFQLNLPKKPLNLPALKTEGDDSRFASYVNSLKGATVIFLLFFLLMISTLDYKLLVIVLNKALSSLYNGALFYVVKCIPDYDPICT